MHDGPTNITPEYRSCRPFNRLLQHTYTSPLAMATTTSMIVLLICLLWSLPLALAAGQVVRIGIYQNSPKVTYSETGQPAGIFVDLIEAIAQQEGWTLEYVPGSWGEGLDRLAAGEIDLMPDVAYSAARDQLFDYHQVAVLSSWFQVYSLPGSGIHSLPDLAGKSVAVLERSVQQAAFEQLVGSFGFKVTLIPVPDYDTLFQRVAAGGAEAAITNRYHGLMHAKKQGLEDTAVIFHPSNLYFAAPSGRNPALLAAIDRHLARMKQDRQSVYYRSLNRWTSEEPDLSLPSWVKVAGVLFALVLLLSFAGAALLKRQINARTLQLRQRNEEMAIINRTLRAISGSLDLSRVLEEAIRGALRLTGFDGGVFCLRDIDKGELRVGAGIHACADTDRAPDGGPLRDANCPGMLEQVARRGHMILQSTDTPAGRRACANVQDDGVHWNAFFPLKSQGQTIGLLCLYSRQPEAPVQRHLDLVQELCVPVALALENARLYEQVSQHARELEQRVAERTRELGEREATARALADEQKLLLEHIPVGILFTGDGRILRANPKFAEIFGYDDSAQLAGTDTRLLFPDAAEAKRFSERVTPALRAGEMIDIEWQGVRRDGRDFLGHTLARPIATPGYTLATVWIVEDITRERAEANTLLQAKQAAEAADRLKSAFLATMSHELRTPLNSIIGFTGIILQELPGPLNDEQKKQLGMVRDSARHLLALINDVLDISKIEAGEMRVRHEPFDLAAVIEKVTGVMRPQVEQKGLALALDIEPGLGQLVGDARRVEQILLNLLGNALKFTEAGQITLTARKDTGYNGNKKTTLRLGIRDTGIGIREEDMLQLFQPFHQIDSTLSRQYEGTGLGLAICRRLAELMGGRIEAESRWGAGSLFSLLLPLDPYPERETM